MKIDEPHKERLGAIYNHKSILYVFMQVTLEAGACKDVPAQYR